MYYLKKTLVGFKIKLKEIYKTVSISTKNRKYVEELLNKKIHIKDDIYKIIDSGNHIYVIIENDIMIAYLYLLPFSNDIIKKGYVSKEIWVHDNYRLQGYGSILYMYIVKMGYSVISDIEQTNNGITLWNKLAKIGTVKVYDIDTGKILNKNNYTNNKIYGNNKYRLILTENSKHVYPKGLELPDIKEDSVLFPILRLTEEQLKLF